MILVAGAGGFIGGHLVAKLLELGHDVHAVDIKPLAEWWQIHPDAVNERADLRDPDACWDLGARVPREIYNLACDMGGMGYIVSHKADCMLSVAINANLLRMAHGVGVERYFYSSSACVYPSGLQDRSDVNALRESDAYPADCEDGYGWEKLFSERLCRHFTEDYGVETRVARYHNCYGPHGSWRGGREKVPAAICRKVAETVVSGWKVVEIWGDGQQTRSFMYVDDCVAGTLRVMGSDLSMPFNVGSAEMVSINELVDAVELVAGTRVTRRYVPGPQGVRGRSSDNALIREWLGWEPSAALAEGLEPTYRWVYDRVQSCRA